MLTELGKLKEARHPLGSRGYIITYINKAQSIWMQKDEGDVTGEYGWGLE